MADILPPPEVFGLPPRFEAWRRHQPSAIMSIIEAEERVVGLVAPTGMGKSIVAVAAAILSGRRVLYLTSSKGLQTQLLRDFGCMGMVDIRGRNNYICVAVPGRTTRCDQAPCVAGWKCTVREDCQYLRAVKRARAASAVVTNYSYWMASQKAEVNLGRIDMLVADESHGVDEVVGRFLEVELSENKLEERWPQGASSMTAAGWREWAKEMSAGIKSEAEEHGLYIRLGGVNAFRLREYTRLKKLSDDVERLSKIADDWIVEVEDDGKKVRVGPVWPKEYTEDVLWRGVGKILLMSATLNRKTMELLGLGGDENAVVMLDYPHTFPTENRLVVHVPTVRMNHKTDRDGLKLWLSRIDQIIDKHITQNGIIHTVSYARRNMVTERSRHRERMLTHGSRDAEAAVARFKRDGGILVSPSVATGYDFPGDQARWQIIGKLPYPDTRNRLVAARCRADTDYAAYVAMMEMVQASGRIVRSEDDWGLTIVIDNNVDDWFMRQYGWLAPKWFREAYRRSVVIP